MSLGCQDGSLGRGTTTVPDNLSSTLVAHVGKRELKAQAVLLLTRHTARMHTHTENDRLPINT